MPSYLGDFEGMKTEKNEVVSVTGKLQPYRPNSIKEYLDERRYAWRWGA